MHEIGDGTLLDRFQAELGGRYVVLGELPLLKPANLGMQKDGEVTPGELILPGTWLCEIGFNDRDVGMQVAQDTRIGRVLVGRNDFEVRRLLQGRNEVLPNQACSSRNKRFDLSTINVSSLNNVE